jgi:hypothetical protein
MTGYRLTLDLKKCWTDISDCKSYSEGDGKFLCDKCGNGKIAINGLCEATGGVSNCEVYTSQNVCESCFNQYYLSNNECLKHPQIENCTTYSASVAKECSVCSDNSYLFSHANYCVLANTIAGCYRYANSDECE